MNVTIRTILEPGNLEKERLVLDASAPVGIGEFAVFCSAVVDGSVTTEIRKTFWFPDLSVKAPGTIVLYTKKGNQSERANKDGSFSYFFYWGLEEPLWGTPNYAAVVAHIDQWISTLKDQEAAEAPIETEQPKRISG